MFSNVGLRAAQKRELRHFSRKACTFKYFDIKREEKLKKSIVFPKLLLAKFLKDIVRCNVPFVKTASMFVRNLRQLLHNFNRICTSCS